MKLATESQRLAVVEKLDAQTQDIDGFLRLHDVDPDGLVLIGMDQAAALVSELRAATDGREIVQGIAAIFALATSFGLLLADET